MSKNTVKYYVNLVPGDSAYKAPVNTGIKKTYYTRTEFAVEHGYQIKVNGIIFSVKEITAEPAKQNSWPEIIISCLLISALLYFLPEEDYHFSKTRWILGLFLGTCFGFVAAQLRIAQQAEIAKNFNKS